MYKNSAFWIRIVLVSAALLLFGGRIHAQSAGLSFDALPRAHRADTTRPPAARPDVALRAQLAAQRDSIARLNQALATPRVRVDTVRVVRVDTVKPSAVAPAKAAAATAAPAFAPTTVSGLLQVQLTGGDAALRSTYRVRRAEVKVVTDLGHRASAVIMVDAAKALALTTAGTSTTVTQSSRVLQDAFVSVPVRRLQIDAGQQRLPLGYEGSFGSSTLETIDRALMESDRARSASFGDVRDLGVAVKSTWRWLDYKGGVYNGSGETMNEADRNVGKALVAQLGVRPAVIKGLRIGASGASSGEASADKPTRDRVGVDVVYAASHALLQAEAMRGQDGAIRRQGAYALAAFIPWKSVKVLARFDVWDPDTRKEAAAADVTERDYLAGLTWLPPATRLKLQLNVVRKTYSHDLLPAVTLAQTQLQASW